MKNGNRFDINVSKVSKEPGSAARAILYSAARAIVLSFPPQLIRLEFVRLALDRLENERNVFFTGGTD